MVDRKGAREAALGPQAEAATPAGEHQLELLAAIARLATEDLELRPMLQRITDAIARLFGWELVALIRIDREAGRFVCEAVTSSRPTAVHPGYGRAFGSGVVGRVAASGVAEEIEDADTDPGFVQTMPGIRSELCVPVRHAGEVVALLNAESSRPGEFRGRLPLLQAVADQVAGAIASARRFEETRRRAASLEVVSEVSRRALESGELNAVLGSIAASVRERLDLYLVAIVVANERGTEWAHRAFALREPRPLPVRPSWPVSAGVVGRAIRTGEPQLVLDIEQDPDYFSVDDRVSAEYAVPIRSRGRILGAFNFENDSAELFSSENLDLLRLLAHQVAGAIELSLLNARLSQTTGELEEANRRLAAANVSLERSSRSDPLTGVANRRQFDESLQLEWRRLIRLHLPLSLLMVDVDCFKAYNDAYGHPRGDSCLRVVAGALVSCFQRAGDVVARYGGEEFAVVLPEIALDEAVQLAETARRRIEELAIPHRGSMVAPVLTVSIGVACRVPRRGVVSHDLVELADRALYAAKRGGRDRVVAGSDPD